MRRERGLFLVLFALTFSPLTCTETVHAWGDLGHQTVAEIADRLIKPQTKLAIERILGPEPLAAAATWPDVVRQDDRFDDFSEYHIVEIAPIPAPGTEYKPHDERGSPKRDGNTVLTQYVDTLRATPSAFLASYGRSLPMSSIRTQKMLALRYIIHATGDVHQPLHSGNGLDKGANLCPVKVKTKIRVLDAGGRFRDAFAVEEINLHTLWDEGIIDFIRDQVHGPDQEVPGAQMGPEDFKAKRFFTFSTFADLIASERVMGLKALLESESVLIKARDALKTDAEKAPFNQQIGLLRLKMSTSFRAFANGPAVLNRANSRDLLNVSRWFADSATLRINKVYPDVEAFQQMMADPVIKTRPEFQRLVAEGRAKLPFEDNRRPYCSIGDGTWTRFMAPVVDETYLARSAEVVKTQILLAGARLAALLDAVMDQNTQADQPSEDWPQILPRLKMRNK